jgi:L-rhamnose-H+ transport protein
MAMYWGGYTAMLIVFGSKILKNKTAKNFTGTGAARDMCLAVGMGLLHYLAQVPYGVGAWFIGPAMGRTIGWAVTIASSLIVANMLGFVTGEWKDAHGNSKKVLFSGLAILIVAMICLAYANSKV